MEPDQYWLQQLEQFLAGKLPPRDEHAFRQRLVVDPDLRNALDRRLTETLDQTLRDQAAAAAYRQEIMRIRQSMPAEPVGSSRRNMSRLLWLALLFLLLLGAGWWWWNTAARYPEEPRETAPTAVPDTPALPLPTPAAPPQKTPEHSAPSRPKSGPPPVAEQTPGSTKEVLVGTPNTQELFSGDIPFQTRTVSGAQKKNTDSGVIALDVLSDPGPARRYRFSKKRLTLLAPPATGSDFSRFIVVELSEPGKPARYFLRDADGQWFPIAEGGKNYTLLQPEPDPAVLDLLN